MVGVVIIVVVYKGWSAKGTDNDHFVALGKISARDWPTCEWGGDFELMAVHRIYIHL